MIDNFKDIAYIIGAIITFLVGRKSTTLTNKGTEIDNLTKYQAMYDKFVEQYQKEFKTLGDKIADLELRNSIVIEESQTWQNKFNNLQKLYDKLKKEFDDYKKNADEIGRKI